MLRLLSALLVIGSQMVSALSIVLANSALWIIIRDLLVGGRVPPVRPWQPALEFVRAARQYVAFAFSCSLTHTLQRVADPYLWQWYGAQKEWINHQQWGNRPPKGETWYTVRDTIDGCYHRRQPVCYRPWGMQMDATDSDNEFNCLWMDEAW